MLLLLLLCNSNSSTYCATVATVANVMQQCNMHRMHLCMKCTSMHVIAIYAINCINDAFMHLLQISCICMSYANNANIMHLCICMNNATIRAYLHMMHICINSTIRAINGTIAPIVQLFVPMVVPFVRERIESFGFVSNPTKDFRGTKLQHFRRITFARLLRSKRF